MLPPIATLTLGLLAAVPTAATAPTDPFAVGQPVPSVVLPAAEDGTPRSLAAYRGKKYVLHVFASW